MDQRPLKYVQIRHWDYWWAVYQCGGEEPSQPNAVEFSLADTGDGGALFFHFDCYNLSGLYAVIREGELIQVDDPDYPTLLHEAEVLSRGGRDYLIGGLYYRDFTPDLAFCNQPLTPNHTLLDRKAPPVSPYYAVLFLAEERPLTPEVLIWWMIRLSRQLFGEEFSFEIACIPTREETLENWQSEQGQAQYEYGN